MGNIPSATMLLKTILLSCLLSAVSTNTFHPSYYSYQPLNYQPVTYPASVDYYGRGYPPLVYPQPSYYYFSPYQPSYAPAYAHTSGSVYPTATHDRDGRVFLLETLLAYKAMSLGSSLLS